MIPIRYQRALENIDHGDERAESRALRQRGLETVDGFALGRILRHHAAALLVVEPLDLTADLLPRGHTLAGLQILQVAILQGFQENLGEDFGVNGLDDVIIHAHPHDLNDGIRAIQRGLHQNHRRRILPAQLLDKRLSVHHRHHQIHDEY
ncbi:MAG: hypothetical protein BWY82_02795 [Verrucomicrobia bacterium ADurb.Bin474]|nr:MAG: hypothetical protein BWY82_02795 [Verrucomicrobia bacterium ADurb.Bin474]